MTFWDIIVTILGLFFFLCLVAVFLLKEYEKRTSYYHYNRRRWK